MTDQEIVDDIRNKLEELRRSYKRAIDAGLYVSISDKHRQTYFFIDDVQVNASRPL